MVTNERTFPVFIFFNYSFVFCFDQANDFLALVIPFVPSDVIIVSIVCRNDVLFIKKIISQFIFDFFSYFKTQSRIHHGGIIDFVPIYDQHENDYREKQTD